MNCSRIILLAEDRDADAELTLRAFQRSDITHEIVLVRDGEEALDYLFARGRYSDRNMDAMPKMILLDLNLPKVDGLEVLRRIKADPRTYLLPVIILTSSTEESDLVSSYGLGANSYVRKPVDFMQFIEVGKQLVHYWLVLNQLPLMPTCTMKLVRI